MLCDKKHNPFLYVQEMPEQEAVGREKSYIANEKRIKKAGKTALLIYSISRFSNRRKAKINKQV